MDTRATPSPLPAVLAFTALSNLATAIATVGVFFLAESAHGFTSTENYQLGLVVGLTYAAAAWKAGPILRLVTRRAAGLCSRGALASMTSALAAICLLPYFVPARWTIYVFAALYMPITGVFWSLVESFLSGGRSGEGLRRAIGHFNVTWSVFMAISMWVIAPLVEEWPLEVFLLIAGVHVVSLLFLVGFDRDPARHVEETHHAPPRYAVLLAGHRVLLVAGYVIMFAISPYMPELLTQLEVPERWRTPLGSVWMPVRVVVFFALGAWHGWHGRRSIGVVGAILLIVGFALTVLAPQIGTRAMGIGSLIVGQIAFGTAIAALYTANLYYTMAVGQSSVDAGGSHEGLIGLGYTIGPLCGWLAGGLSSMGVLPAASVDEAVVIAIELLALTAAIWAWRVSRPRTGA